MRHLVPISGKDSLATAIAQRTRCPELHYEYIYADTRMELPETYTWLNHVERSLGISIHRLGKSLEEVIAEQGMIPSPQRRFCTKYSKLFPMRDWVNGDDAIMYIGLRADEDRNGAQETRKIRVRYPLKEMGITLPMVYAILDKVDLYPPTFFWGRLHKAVVDSLGSLAWVIGELPRYVFDRSFAWRSRPNCFMCFYQRQYEWVGLSEFHPELFSRAEGLEAAPNERREKPYFWVQDQPLSRIRERASEIFDKRVEALSRLLAKRAQSELFNLTLLDELDMAQTSCGMFCGK